jgi:hypothetical protein
MDRKRFDIGLFAKGDGEDAAELSDDDDDSGEVGREESKESTDGRSLVFWDS